MDRKQQYKKLIEIVKEYARQNGYKLRNEDIAKKLGYERPYLSQLVGPKGVVNESHILVFKQKFSEELKNSNIPMPGDPSNEERSLLLAIFDDYSELVSKIENVDKSVVIDRLKNKANLILTGLNSQI